MTQRLDISSPLKVTKTCQSKNRLFKSAMSEQLADENRDPDEKLIRLYETWAKGGTGIIVTGNVMIDRTAIGEIKNVALDEQSNLTRFKEWAKAGSTNGTSFWMQLNHPGKQVPSFLAKTPVAPSAVPLGAGLKKAFNTPRALTEDEILEIIRKFAWAAKTAKDCGFHGVQIHGAHGYLVSQFLSPHHNRRDDKWGGNLENRMRFACEVYRAIRKEVGADYPVGIKLNSADFQKGGFEETDSISVITKLQEEGIDLLEVSGGNYENPSMVGSGAKESTLKREAYFLDYAAKAKKVLDIPVVVTGGFRSAPGMNSALASGALDAIGMARPLAVDPALSNKLLSDANYKIVLPNLSTGIAMVNQMTMLDITWYEQQLDRIGSGLDPDLKLGAWRSAFKTLGAVGRHAFTKRRA